MEREQKRMLALGILIVLVIIFSVIYFLWGSFIDRGTLRVTGDAPFVVKVFNDKAYECPTSPCEIKQPTGLKDLIIEKKGFKTFLTESEVKLWRTVDLSINFEIVPALEKVESMPPAAEEIEYRLVEDKSNSQKLIRVGDERATALAFFPNSFKNPRLFSSKNNVLIIDQSQIYLIDTQLSKKEKIVDTNLRNLKSAKWSPNGNYLVFEKNNSDSLWLLDAQSRVVEQLSVATPLSSTGWDYSGNLIFVTEQAYENEIEGRINLFEERLPGNFLFASYRPKEKNYYIKAVFTEITELPKELLFTPDGQYLYFQSGAEDFRIILRKF